MEASVTVLPECRVCLGVENLLHSLFDVYEEKYFLPQIIFDCIGLEVRSNCKSVAITHILNTISICYLLDKER